MDDDVVSMIRQALGQGAGGVQVLLLPGVPPPVQGGRGFHFSAQPEPFRTQNSP